MRQIIKDLHKPFGILAVISVICSICLIGCDQHIVSAEWKVRSEIFLKELPDSRFFYEIVMFMTAI